MNLQGLLDIYKNDDRINQILEKLRNSNNCKLKLNRLVGSSQAFLAATIIKEMPAVNLFVLADKESAAFFANDLENIFGEKNSDNNKKKILFFPTSYKYPYQAETNDPTSLQLRTEVLKRISAGNKKTAIVTYPEALTEKVINKNFLYKKTFNIRTGEEKNLDTVIDVLYDYHFTRVDFVSEAGEFSVRGGIIDIFSFSNEFPYRIEFMGTTIESLRSFDPANQLSLEKLREISIIPNIQHVAIDEPQQPLWEYLPDDSLLWLEDTTFISNRMEQEYLKAEQAFEKIGAKTHRPPHELFTREKYFLQSIATFSVLELSKKTFFTPDYTIHFDTEPQISFKKNFELLLLNLQENTKQGIQNLIFSDNPNQIERLNTIFKDMQAQNMESEKIKYHPVLLSIHEGFQDKNLQLACYTDHQIFERYHRFHLKSSYKTKEAVCLKDLHELRPGDYVTHIDHGIGRFDGLEKIENNGKKQEAIRLIYKNNDLLYISIHSLHRIAKYMGKEGTAPVLNKLGSNAWNKLKAKTKSRVKDIAKDLIRLYAERKSSKGMQYNPDTYLQHELEASFIYEDTPDQLKATLQVKKDMEESFPMDRLVCGDVGFGKTEVAIRAAFKAVGDNKQVAVLVPTTILAFQHYNTFSDRLQEFPCKVDYINRFKSSTQQKQTLKDLESGKTDILIGTHRLVSKDVKFKDLGLLIIDEEQKFGVSIKEKLKQLKSNVDTLTLTATPIPRTLQFSLMGARDLSVINTPPPNRYPVQTEICQFSEKIIRESIMYEISRGGQVYFVHNRVQNIMDVKQMLEKFCPEISIEIAHGQMGGTRLENIMLAFIKGEFDVLLSTTIIESGLDIPNVNTILINDAQNYGLSDLHQLRGRVGRTNKKAFCYLLSPPLSALTDEARKRLKTIEEFADLGSGLSISMRDLDIRGAGNILGAEQSGFISEIGFEMYNQIIDEAILELKENEFKDVFTEENTNEYVRDCQIETDLELLIPDNYISHISERLSLYKELDDIEQEEGLEKFKANLTDRFGPVPPQTQELINAVRLRRMAKQIGFEKLILKNDRLHGYFISKQDSPYYESTLFNHILKFVQNNPQGCSIAEKNNKLRLSFPCIKTISDALYKLDAIIKYIDKQALNP